MENVQNQKKSDSHDLLVKILKNPVILKNKVKTFVDEVQIIYQESIAELADLSNYVLANWRSWVLPLVEFGLSVILKTTATIQETSKSKTKGTLPN